MTDHTDDRDLKPENIFDHVARTLGAEHTLCPTCEQMTVDGLGICRRCRDRQTRERAEASRSAAAREGDEQLHRANIASVLGSIPERYRWARYDAPELVSRLGDPRGIRRSQELRLDGRVAVVHGPAGAGKTALSVARFADELERPLASKRWGYSSRFVPCYAIGEAASTARLGQPKAVAVELARRAHLLLLDDLGTEPNIEPVKAELRLVLHERFDLGLSTIVTTGLTRPQVAERYGDGVARRLFEASVLQVYTR